MHRRLMPLIALLLLVPHARAGEPAFVVRFDERLELDGPVSGRLMVFLLSADSPLYRTRSAKGAPFFSDPQPMFGVDVVDADPTSSIAVGDDATSFPAPPSALPPGHYRVAAVLDRRHANSSWQKEPGNLFSEEYTLVLDPGASPESFALTLSGRSQAQAFPEHDGLSELTVPSPTLERAGAPFASLRCAIVEPLAYDPERVYAAVYTVPGFGGDHRMAARLAEDRARIGEDDPRRFFHEHTFIIVLDPEGPNGHHTFANSANNGPVAQALVNDLIPAIEERYPSLIARPEARLITGHSSGGWACLWLALTQPETFGACYASAPDPIDFRAFQRMNLYEDGSLFENDGVERASFLIDGRVRMSVRQEVGMERVMGPSHTSAQQWAAWCAVFTPRADDGSPVGFFDDETGAIDRAIVEGMRAFDIGHLTRSDPDSFLPLWRERVELLVGDADNFDLHRAVELVRDDLRALSAERNEPDASVGIAFVAGADHGGVTRSPESRAWVLDMMRRVRALPEIARRYHRIVPDDTTNRR